MCIRDRHNGYELLFLNGTAVNEQDYDITGNALVITPASATGKINTIQFSAVSYTHLTLPTKLEV
ncbi:hypothetical protein JMUB7547_28280 [Staphylococcus aureus]